MFPTRFWAEKSLRLGFGHSVLCSSRTALSALYSQCVSSHEWCMTTVRRRRGKFHHRDEDCLRISHHMCEAQTTWTIYDQRVLYQNVLLWTPSTANSSSTGRIAVAISGNNNSCGPALNSSSTNSGASRECRMRFDSLIHSVRVMLPGL